MNEHDDPIANLKQWPCSVWGPDGLGVCGRCVRCTATKLLKERDEASRNYESASAQCLAADKAMVAALQEVEKLKADLADAGEALWQDESRMLGTLHLIRKEIRSYEWLLESRGPYEWDDDKYKDEAGRCMRTVDELADKAMLKSQKRMKVGEKRLDGVGKPHYDAKKKIAALQAIVREALPAMIASAQHNRGCEFDITIVPRANKLLED